MNCGWGSWVSHGEKVAQTDATDAYEKAMRRLAAIQDPCRYVRPDSSIDVPESVPYSYEDYPVAPPSQPTAAEQAEKLVAELQMQQTPPAVQVTPAVVIPGRTPARSGGKMPTKVAPAKATRKRITDLKGKKWAAGGRSKR